MPKMLRKMLSSSFTVPLIPFVVGLNFELGSTGFVSMQLWQSCRQRLASRWMNKDGQIYWKAAQKT